MPSPPRPAPTDAPATCAIGADLWFRAEPDGTYVMGLTEAAQRRAGPLAHYRGPVAGRAYRAGEPALSLESEKWVGHLGLPVDGQVVATNPAAEADPPVINRDPYGAGWLYRMRPREPGTLEALAGRPG
ncbi:MAG TPA: glycine cleavage system protein H [Thermoplasmata archaeon]|nr:glycine cleavage system protein H [Thermoplasmata archaeon]